MSFMSKGQTTVDFLLTYCFYKAWVQTLAWSSSKQWETLKMYTLSVNTHVPRPTYLPMVLKATQQVLCKHYLWFTNVHKKDNRYACIYTYSNVDKLRQNEAVDNVYNRGKKSHNGDSWIKLFSIVCIFCFYDEVWADI